MTAHGHMLHVERLVDMGNTGRTSGLGWPDGYKQIEGHEVYRYSNRQQNFFHSVSRSFGHLARTHASDSKSLGLLTYRSWEFLSAWLWIFCEGVSGADLLCKRQTITFGSIRLQFQHVYYLVAQFLNFVDEVACQTA